MINVFENIIRNFFDLHNWVVFWRLETSTKMCLKHDENILFVNILTYTLKPCFKNLKLVHESVWNMIEKYFSQIFFPTYLNHVPKIPKCKLLWLFQAMFHKKTTSYVLASCFKCFDLMLLMLTCFEVLSCAHLKRCH